jgi:GT2 family glycosyltransferase
MVRRSPRASKGNLTTFGSSICPQPYTNQYHTYMNGLTLGVVIPTYSAGPLLVDAIESVRRCEESGVVRAIITVVDNHPTNFDRTFAAMADNYISLPKNLGFGAAANAGITSLLKNEEINFFLLLNPDARLSENFFDVLEPLLNKRSSEVMNPISPLICFDQSVKLINTKNLFQGENSQVKIIDLNQKFLVFDKNGEGRTDSDRSYFSLSRSDYLVLKNGEESISDIAYMDYHGGNNADTIKNFPVAAEDFTTDYIIQNAGSEIYSPTSAGDLNFGWLASPASKNIGGPRRAWCGAGVILPRSYINQVGLFDTSFFLYYEDTEISLRGSKKGAYPILQPSLQIFHRHSAITNANPATRNKSIWRSRQIFAARIAGLTFSFLYAISLLGVRIIQVIRGGTSFRHFVRVLTPEIYNTFVGTLIAILRIFKFRKWKI